MSRVSCFIITLFALCLVLPCPAHASERQLHVEEDSLIAAELFAVEALPGTDLALVALTAAGRQLTMFTGLAEASAILRAPDGARPGRPQTHELLESTLIAAGYTVKRVVVDRLDAEGNFHAAIELQDSEGKALRLDSRPSDAIALALRFSARLFVAREVMEAAAQEEQAPSLPQIAT